MTNYIKRGRRVSTGLDQMGMPIHIGVLSSGIISEYDYYEERDYRYFHVTWNAGSRVGQEWSDEIDIGSVGYYAFMGGP